MKGNWHHSRQANKPRKRETEGYMILYISHTSKITHFCNSSDDFEARSLYSANLPKSTQIINWLHMMSKQMKKRNNCFRVLPTFYLRVSLEI